MEENLHRKNAAEWIMYWFLKVFVWLRDGIGDRLQGIAEFLGMLLGILGSFKRLGLAIGAACLAGGLGESLNGSGCGPFWMSAGAFLIVLYAPIHWKN